jgi:uncharacterized Rossmann fold enzyme
LLGVLNAAKASTISCPENPRLRNRVQLWSTFWLHLYDIVRGSLGYSVSDDCYAAKVLDSLLGDADIEGRYLPLERLCSIIDGRRVCIFGASDGVEDELELGGCDVVVAVDGVTALMLEYGLRPDIVFTDLDGSLNSIELASKLGSVVVVHAHGDNVALVKYTVPRLSIVHGTVQCGSSWRHATILGGFTDGDRAIAASLLCGASQVRLHGMRFWRKTSRYSKPWLRTSVDPWPEKKAKLAWGVRLVSYLLRVWEALGVEITWFNG